MEQGLDRAAFLRLTGAFGAGLGIALYVPGCAPQQEGNLSGGFAPNAWVHIAPDETVTVFLSKSEMGQGVATGLPTILADELDAAIEKVRFQFAPADPRFIDPAFREMVTGASQSLKDTWMPLRSAGATARAMLVAAAAKQWSVDPATCSTKDGVVYHESSRRSATYGSLAGLAASLAVPTTVKLKKPDEFRLIGRHRARPDIPFKVNGKATYGIDVSVPGMLYAAIARPPVFGGRVRSFNATRSGAVSGVLRVVEISSGVAVVAKNTWAAFQGKQALEIVWDDGPKGNVSSDSLFREAEHLAQTHEGEHTAVTRGNPDRSVGTVLAATYRGPFLAHATMEPQNATAYVRDDRCEVWAPTQAQTRAQTIAAKVTGLAPAKCVVHTTFLGGGFGRRLEMDYVQEAVEVSKATKAPVKVMWTREDDIQHDFYRPMAVNVVRGVVENRELTTLTHQKVAGSWLHRWEPSLFRNGWDYVSLEDAFNIPYAIPNFRSTFIEHKHGIPLGSWRAPGANWNAFVTESFIDELADAAGRDPLEFRLSLLKHNPRATAVLQLVAEKARWKQEQRGIGQGLALVLWAGSYGALIAEVSMQGNIPKVHRVVAAVDVGTVVNPDIVIQQAQGAANFGLSAALTGKITIERGRVRQNNFYDYTVLRMADAPSIDVHIVPSVEPPSGIGELCTPLIGPAVGNALFALTGKRIRTLPLSDALANQT
jgi:isoquinoline 1-oxidoreductase subunit beta